MKDRLKRLCILVRAKIGFIDDKAGNPVGINDHIGRRPVAAIYTGGGGFAMLRRIVIRTYSWLNYLYPIPF